MRVEAVINHDESSAFVSLWDVMAVVARFNQRCTQPPPPFTAPEAVGLLEEITPEEALHFWLFLEAGQFRYEPQQGSDERRLEMLDRYERVRLFTRAVSRGTTPAVVIG